MQSYKMKPDFSHEKPINIDLIEEFKLWRKIHWTSLIGGFFSGVFTVAALPAAVYYGLFGKTKSQRINPLNALLILLDKFEKLQYDDEGKLCLTPDNITKASDLLNAYRLIHNGMMTSNPPKQYLEKLEDLFMRINQKLALLAAVCTVTKISEGRPSCGSLNKLNDSLIALITTLTADVDVKDTDAIQKISCEALDKLQKKPAI
ncbi:MAG: hypothetical protein ACYCQI_08290 [Gammaproteobacteria bacterium]